MIVGTVIGNLWATRKEEALVGLKFLIVQPENLDCTPIGSPLVVIDRIGAGEGDKVLITQGSSARYVQEDRNLPIDAAIIGIIDREKT